jgi:hypothetical protein
VHLLCGALLACGPTGVASRAALEAPAAVSPASDDPPSASNRVRLRVSLRPETSEGASRSSVSLTLWGTDGERTMWQVPGTWPGSTPIQVTCTSTDETRAERSPVSRQTIDGEPDGIFNLSEACHDATVQLDYVLSKPPLGHTLWRLDERGFVARGHDLLVLPNIGDVPTETSVEIDARAFGTDGRAVSSIGIGAERQAPMTREALQNAWFAAGWFGSAVFEASEGHDEAAWFGSPAFDPRPLAAEVASFRSAVRERFRDHHFRPLTLILIVDPSVDEFEVARAPVSIIARVAPGAVLSARLRLAILHQVMKEWVGGQLALEDDVHEELAWFTEGFSRYFARELAFSFGLLSSSEYIDEVNALLATQAIILQPENARCRGQRPDVPSSGAPSCVLLDVTRGALHASELDVALRAGHGSLLEVVAELLRRRPGRLSLSAWQAVLGDADPDARLSKRFADGGAIIPPAAAFGRCFARGPRRYAESLRGFEYTWTSGTPFASVTSVDPHGPAAVAGLRAGDALERIDHLPIAPKRPIVLIHPGGERREYRGQLRTLASVGWTLVADPHDPRCAPE